MVTTKIMRDIIKIDEEKCDGCGVCVLGCAEGALQIIDGKAKLISEVYCDGLGACIGECPQGALTVEKRESVPFDEVAVGHHLEKMNRMAETSCGCSSAAAQQFDSRDSSGQTLPQPSMLSHWPVQLGLLGPNAPFLEGADVLLVAHCAPFAYGNFHQDFIKDHVVLCACPKLDNFEAHQARLNQILAKADIKSLTVLRMEVPCCGGLMHLAKEATKASGKNIPLKEEVIGMKGDILGGSF